MNKASLLTAVSIIALSADGALGAGPPKASFPGEARPFHVPMGAKVL